MADAVWAAKFTIWARAEGGEVMELPQGHIGFKPTEDPLPSGLTQSSTFRFAASCDNSSTFRSALVRAWGSWAVEALELAIGRNKMGRSRRSKEWSRRRRDVGRKIRHLVVRRGES